MVPNGRVEPFRLDDVDPAAEQSFDIGDQPAGKEWCGVRTRIHQLVEVAIWSSLTPRYRSEDPDVVGAVARCDRENLLASGADIFRDCR
jgi:hypothetical protein